MDSNPRLRWQFKRRWLRISLRTLLVLLTVACLSLGWLANRANQQRQAVQWVTELGGWVQYDYEWGTSIIDAEPPGPDWLRHLIGFDYFANVVMVDLAHTQVSDMTQLAKLKSLKQLNLEVTQVSDVTPLANLTDLEYLYVGDTQVSDVTTLANLTKLKQLQLDNTQVSDVTPLAKLTNLKQLQLAHTQTSDITPLANLTNLVNLDLSDTQVRDVTM